MLSFVLLRISLSINGLILQCAIAVEIPSAQDKSVCSYSIRGPVDYSLPCFLRFLRRQFRISEIFILMITSRNMYNCNCNVKYTHLKDVQNKNFVFKLDPRKKAQLQRPNFSIPEAIIKTLIPRNTISEDSHVGIFPSNCPCEIIPRIFKRKLMLEK